MAQICKPSVNPLQFNAHNHLFKAQRKFVRFMDLRYRTHIAIGNQIDTGRKTWHIVLVDTKKFDQYLEKMKTGPADVDNYGWLLMTGFGDVPREILDNSVSKIVYKDLLMVKMPQGNTEEILYVLSDSGKKREVLEANSVEEIENHGTILYKAICVEPPECVSYYILKQLFLAKSNKRNLESTRLETSEVLNINYAEENGLTRLHHASYYGSLDMVKNLVSEGADIQQKDNVCERLAVHFSAMQGHIGVVEHFLNNGISVNTTDENGWTLLHYAVWRGNVQAIRYLIQKGINMNVKDKCLGKTPLMVGAEKGHTEAVKLLLQKDALIDEVDDFGNTSIYYSSMAGYIDTVKLLILKGANIHISNKYGHKPLHVAVCYDNKEMAELLINNGSVIDMQDNLGDTPLHEAAKNGFRLIVCSLFNNGANMNIVNNNGKTPFDCGILHKDVASYLAAKMIKAFLTQGNLDEAFKVSKELLKIHGDKLSTDQVETLDIMCKLAKILFKEGQYVKSLEILKNVDLKNCSSSNEYDILRTKCELQLCLDETQCNFKSVVESLKCVFEILKRDVLNADQNGSLNNDCNIALVHFSKREYDETFNVLRNALGPKKIIFAADQTNPV